MNYTLKVLNEDATLNNYVDIGSATIYKGADAKLILQLFQPDRKIRFMPGSAAVITIDFLKSDNTVLTKTATFPFSPDDRSIIQIVLTDLETATIISQNLVAKITDGSDIQFAVLPLGLQMASTSQQGC